MQLFPDRVNESENEETGCSYSIECRSFGLALVSQFDNAFSLIVSVDSSIDVRCSAGAEIDSRRDAKTISCAPDINCLRVASIECRFGCAWLEACDVLLQNFARTELNK